MLIPVRKSRRASRSLARAVLESLDPRTLFSAYTLNTLAQFTGANGSQPFGSDLTIDSHGNLFGSTTFGGAFNARSVVEIAHGSNTITTRASFNGTTNGGYPSGKLLIDNAGNIYGVSGGDYPSDDGSIF